MILSFFKLSRSFNWTSGTSREQDVFCKTLISQVAGKECLGLGVISPDWSSTLPEDEKSS